MVLDTRQENRSERIQARATKQAKELLEQAAAVQGVSLSDFVISTALEQANKTLQAHGQLELSARDSRAFAEALINPPAPNEALLVARDRHLAEVER
ncbi:MAG: DUF1778 domain-containing protein [Trueperaceae bacterium]|nr:DUF1778 domain-containing protein [Trueperaceae bacterium]